MNQIVEISTKLNWPSTILVGRKYKMKYQPTWHASRQNTSQANVIRGALSLTVTLEPTRKLTVVRILDHTHEKARDCQGWQLGGRNLTVRE